MKIKSCYIYWEIDIVICEKELPLFIFVEMKTNSQKYVLKAKNLKFWCQSAAGQSPMTLDLDGNFYIHLINVF